MFCHLTFFPPIFLFGDYSHARKTTNCGLPNAEKLSTNQRFFKLSGGRGITGKSLLSFFCPLNSNWTRELSVAAVDDDGESENCSFSVERLMPPRLSYPVITSRSPTPISFSADDSEPDKVEDATVEMLATHFKAHALLYSLETRVWKILLE